MNSRGLRSAGVLIVMLFAAWAGFRVYSSLRYPAGHVPVYATVPVPVGQASPPTDLDTPAADEGTADQSLPAPPPIPERLPEFALNDPSGNPVSIATWRGKSLIINFWATWCAPCRHEIPLLQALDREWRGRRVQVVGIAVDHRDKVRAFADDLRITYPLLVGEEDALDVAGAFGVTSPAFPFSVFTDSRGRVVALYVGELHRPQADLILAVVQQVNADRLPLGAARDTITRRLRQLHAAPAG